MTHGQRMYARRYTYSNNTRARTCAHDSQTSKKVIHVIQILETVAALSIDAYKI